MAVVLLDVSMPVAATTAPWPGDTPFECGFATKAQTGSVNVGWARTSPHVGTHVDAPFHYDDAGARVGGLDPAAFVGPCHVVDAVGRAELGVDLLRGLDLEAAPRVLFRTRARNDPEAFVRVFPLLTRDSVDTLARAGVRLVGIDAPSYDAFDSRDLPVHHALGAAGIANVENLVLDGVAPGRYEFLGAPVLWRDMDAAPLRALLRR